ncbi:MAG: sigma-70 family RNA polymerase sigma factor [Oscillospiraceae bacterium]
MRDEREWFCECIRDCQDSLYALAYGILQNTEDAKDAVQDTIWKAYDHLDTLKSRGKFRPWIMQIQANTAYEICRRRRDLACFDEQWETAAQEAAVDVHTRLTLWDAVQKLAPAYRDVVILFYYEGFSVKRIAGITGRRQDAVKKQLSRARDQLRELLEEEVSG